MNARLATLAFLVLTVVTHGWVSRGYGQVGQFDSIELGNGLVTPFIEFENGQSEFFYINGFDDEMAFFIKDNYKFKIEESALENGLVLDSNGVNLKREINITDIPTIFGAYPVLSATPTGSNKTFGIGVFKSDASFAGGIGLFNKVQQTPSLFVGGTAKDFTLSLHEDGVGVGIFEAKAPLHVYSDDIAYPLDHARVLVENDFTGTPMLREMFSLVNNGGTQFSFTDTSIGSKWTFSSNPIGLFSISKAGTGGSEFRVYPSGRFVVGPGGQRSFDLSPNGDLEIMGTLTQSSDRAMKTEFSAVDSSEVLNRVRDMPVTTWRYKSNRKELRHMGPTAQDFHEAFGLGKNDKTIAVVDGIGVSLAAIQALDKAVQSKENEIKELKQQLADQQEMIRSMASRLDALEAKR